ncbi:MAG TPA: hypothetical protein VLB45_00600 [Nitrosopumilaceae archaeon]|nr:hypothetical protein [Nitrosopumilaceae archaeon]
MAVQNTALLVFLFPVVISAAFGTFVLSGVLTEPNRELNMWPFEIATKPPVGNEDIQIQNLLKQYSTSTPVEIKVLVSNLDFDCGDLYITIYDTVAPKDVIAQNGFFNQCFSEGNVLLPIGDTFSEKVGKSGEYEIVVEMNDKDYEKTVSATAKFRVQ